MTAAALMQTEGCHSGRTQTRQSEVNRSPTSSEVEGKHVWGSILSFCQTLKLQNYHNPNYCPIIDRDGRVGKSGKISLFDHSLVEIS